MIYPSLTDPAFRESTHNMATMEDLVEEILAELPDPVQEGLQFTDLDDQVPPPERLPADRWVDILNNDKDEFDVDGASAVFTTWRVEEDDPLDIGDIEIADGMYARAGRWALNARMADVRAALPEGDFILSIKFLRENDDD